MKPQEITIFPYNCSKNLQGRKGKTGTGGLLEAHLFFMPDVIAVLINLEMETKLNIRQAAWCLMCLIAF